MAWTTRPGRALVVGVALCGFLGTAVSPVGATPPATPGTARGMIVVFRGVTPAAGLRSAHASVGDFAVTKSYRRIPAVRAELTPAQIQTLQRHPEIARVEPDRIISIKPEMVGDVTHDGFSRVGSARSDAIRPEIAKPTAAIKPAWPTPVRAADPGIAAAEKKLGLNGDAAHDGITTYGPADEVIAIVDSGVDATHPDLAGGKILKFQDFVTTPDPSCPTVADPTVSWDDVGHGTHVAGIAAGTGAADPTKRGVAPGAALVVLKIFDCTGTATAARVLSALDWLLVNHSAFGVDVVNMSFSADGVGDGTDVLARATNQLAAAGMVPVVAAGNVGPSNYTVGSPGAARYALTVGAIKSSALGRGLTNFSSRGPTWDGRIKPDVATPGVDILAAGNVAFGTTRYRALSGTSMATPVTAGLAALALQANPTLAPSGTACDPVADPVGCGAGVVDASMSYELILRARTTAADWNARGPDNEVGYGVLNAFPFLRSAAGSALRGPAAPKHVALQGRIDPQHVQQLVAVRAEKDAIVTAGVTPGFVDSFDGPFTGIVAFDASGVGVPVTPDCANGGWCSVGFRFQSVWFKAPATGTYFIGVRALAGATGYIIDIDGARSVAGNRHGTCPSPPPVKGQQCATDPMSISVAPLAEGGPAVSVSVHLARRPSKSVQVRLVGDGQITAPAATLTFTPTNWAVPQVLAVSAVDDTTVEGLHHGKLFAVAAGAAFSDSSATNPIAVPIADNDGPEDAPHTERVSLRDDDYESWGGAYEAISFPRLRGPLSSNDGSVVAFESRATDLAGPDASGLRTDVFVREPRDRPHRGHRGTAGDAFLNGMSGDGRYVLFSSLVALVPSDTNGDFDLYLRDRATGKVSRVNEGPNGEQMPERSCRSNFSCHSVESALSADGRWVAWLTDGAMTADDTDSLPDVYLRDLASGTVRRVSVRSDGTSGTSSTSNFASLMGFLEVELSRDGSVVTFTTWTDGLAPGDTPGTLNMFSHVVATGATTLVNADATGAALPSRGLVIYGALAGNGKFAVFRGIDPATGVDGVLVKNLETGAVQLVDEPGRDPACFPTGISDDGRTVAFFICASPNGPSTVLRNLDTGNRTEIVWGSIAHIDDDARFAVFDSPGANFVSGDENGAIDTFLRILR